MKILITVSQLNPGGGLTKYVTTLAEILSKDTNNIVWVLNTHPSLPNSELKKLNDCECIRHVDLGSASKLVTYWSLIKYVYEIKPDVIICNYNAPTQYILPLIPHKIKVVHIIHSSTEDYFRIAAINGKRVNQWIAPTPAVANYFNNYTQNQYKERTKSIPHGVKSYLKKLNNKRESIIELIYVGVLYEHKGVKILPDIIKGLLEKHYIFHFTIVGEGVLREELEFRLQEEISNGVVTFTGQITGEEVYSKLTAADIFVYPTHLDSFGLVIAEAMINHTVPIVTHLEGITDTLVDDGLNGFLVKQDDINTFITLIESLISDESLLNLIADRAQDKAIRYFSTDAMAHNYEEMLRSLVNCNVK